jgi:hypothetical protein
MSQTPGPLPDLLPASNSSIQQSTGEPVEIRPVDIMTGNQALLFPSQSGNSRYSVQFSEMTPRECGQSRQFRGSLCLQSWSIISCLRAGAILQRATGNGQLAKSNEQQVMSHKTTWSTVDMDMDREWREERIDEADKEFRCWTGLAPVDGGDRLPPTAGGSGWGLDGKRQQSIRRERGLYARSATG